jgi:hypothetical protein
MNSSDISIEAGPIQIRITPYGFHMYAQRFLRVAKTVKAEPTFSPVPYYLYCRALELVLKAYLLVQGLSEKQVTCLRHDLTRVLKKARRLGLDNVVTISKPERAEISKANSYYKKKGFEYFQVGRAARAYPDLPDLNVLDGCVSRLVEQLRQVCLDAA